MKSVNLQTQAVQPIPEHSEVDFSELARSQWVLLRKFESDYRGRTVYGTNCKFEDDAWFNGDGRSDQVSLNWGTLPNFSKPLQLLLKVVFFEMSSTRRLVITTLKCSKLPLVQRTILSIIQGRGLLTANEDEFLLGLNAITDNDLVLVVDTLLATASSEPSFVQDCYELTSLFRFINQATENIPLYQIHARLPWQAAGIIESKWAERRAKDLNHCFRTPVGYTPLASETVNAIIERSLSIVCDNGHHLEPVSKVLAFFDARYGDAKYELKNRKTAVTALQTYGPIFSDVIAPPIIDGIKSKTAISMVIIWLRNLLYLARAACVNIILLTTGLRNFDVRGLQVNCSRKSGRVDMLFYLDAYIKKTKNSLILPVPEQTHKAVCVLQSIKFTQSTYLLDGLGYPAGAKSNTFCETDANARVLSGDGLNKLLRDFAAHFKIPFASGEGDSLDSAHCYRTTVAGWLSSASALSVLMVRRLFGHSNDVMPTVYLRNNPSFLKEMKEDKARAAAATAREMAFAAANGQIAGMKGEQLEAGYKLHASRFEEDKTKSHSLTDSEIVTSFSKILEQRLLDESIFGFLTPFGVRCARNPNDTTQAPCAKRSQRDKTADIEQSLLDTFSSIDPANCIGTSCSESLIGPWSESIKDALLWYAKLVRHQLGGAFTDAHFREHAIAFIRQYSIPIKKVFRVEVSTDGTVTDLAAT